MNVAPGSNHYLNQNNLTIINQNNLTTCQYKDKHKVFNMQVFFLKYFLIHLDHSKLIHPVDPDRHEITVYDIIEFGWSAIHVSQE